MKEMTGSGIFVEEEEDNLESGSANPTSGSKTGLRMYQVSFNHLHLSYCMLIETTKCFLFRYLLYDKLTLMFELSL